MENLTTTSTKQESIRTGAYHPLGNRTCFGVATRSQYEWGNPQVNKFEDVSNDVHQISPQPGGRGAQTGVG